MLSPKKAGKEIFNMMRNRGVVQTISLDPFEDESGSSSDKESTSEDENSEIQVAAKDEGIGESVNTGTDAAKKTPPKVPKSAARI